MFSLNLVGVVGEYSREWRLVRVFELDDDEQTSDSDVESDADAEWYRIPHRTQSERGFIAVRNDIICISDAKTVKLFTSNGSFLRKLVGLSQPCGVAFDIQGNALVADDAQFSDHGIVSFFDGDVGCLSQQIHLVSNNLTSLCCAPITGDVYVCEDSKVVVLDARGHLRHSLRCGNMSPWSIAVSHDLVLVTDRAERCVWVFNVVDGAFLYRFGVEDRCFPDPTGVAYDLRSDDVLVCDSVRNRVQTFSVDGAPVQSIQLPGQPHDVCFDTGGTDGFAYVCGQDTVWVLAY
jgi:DNA-binding beta-propeller fold protein YncE